MMKRKSVAVVFNNGSVCLGKRKYTRYGMEALAYRIQTTRPIGKVELYRNMSAMTAEERTDLIDKCVLAGNDPSFFERWDLNTTAHNLVNARRNLASIENLVLDFQNFGKHISDDQKLTWTFPGGMPEDYDAKEAKKRGIERCVITALCELEEETGITEDDVIMPPLRIIQGVGNDHDVVFFNLKSESEYATLRNWEPDSDEITRCEWVNIRDAEPRLEEKTIQTNQPHADRAILQRAREIMEAPLAG